MKGKKRMKYVNILLCVEGLVLDGESIRLIDARLDEYVIPYEEIVLAYITSREGKVSASLNLEILQRIWKVLW
jgi:hypothetical protein